jgi:signal transduction histidine kinase
MLLHETAFWHGEMAGGGVESRFFCMRSLNLFFFFLFLFLYACMYYVLLRRVGWVLLFIISYHGVEWSGDISTDGWDGTFLGHCLLACWLRDIDSLA